MSNEAIGLIETKGLVAQIEAHRTKRTVPGPGIFSVCHLESSLFSEKVKSHYEPQALSDPPERPANGRRLHSPRQVPFAVHRVDEAHRSG